MKNLNDIKTLLDSKEEMKKRTTSKIVTGIQVLSNAKKLVVLNAEIDSLEEYISELPTENYLKAISKRKLIRILDTDGLGEEVTLQYKSEVNLINWMLG